MHAEFFVATCFEISGLGVVVSGEVKSGEISEGAVGRTSRGKKCVVVKIESEGERMPVAKVKDKVSIVLKYITKLDVKAYDHLYFE